MNGEIESGIVYFRFFRMKNKKFLVIIKNSFLLLDQILEKKLFMAVFLRNKYFLDLKFNLDFIWEKTKKCLTFALTNSYDFSNTLQRSHMKPQYAKCIQFVCIKSWIARCAHFYRGNQTIRLHIIKFISIFISIFNRYSYFTILSSFTCVNEKRAFREFRM